MTGFPLDSDCFQFGCNEHPDAGQLGCGGVCGDWPWWVLSRGRGRGVLSSQRLHTAVRLAVAHRLRTEPFGGCPQVLQLVCSVSIRLVLFSAEVKDWNRRLKICKIFTAAKLLDLLADMRALVERSNLTSLFKAC